ncbi:MAG: cytochrome c maturation protein CcmE [Candidatus Berkiella sp.]
MSVVHKKRLMVVVMLIAGLGLTMTLTLFALKQNINLFYAPSELLLEKIPSHKTIRVGGMVVKNSVVRYPDLGVEFVITDFNKQIKIRYQGILPDLFKENQGVVVQGVLEQNGEFKASQVLAKHDENYMPPEVASALKGKAG